MAVVAIWKGLGHCLVYVSQLCLSHSNTHSRIFWNMRARIDPRFLPSHCSAILSDPGHHVNGQGWLSTSKKGQKSTEEQTQMSETSHLDMAHLTPLHALTARTESHACILASRGTGSSDQLQLRNIGRGQNRFWLLPPVSVTMTDSQEFSPSLAGGHRFT